MKKQLSLALAAAGLTIASQGAMAMTAAGTDILNTVNLTYSVGSQAQTPVSANATFKVDRLVNYTIVADATANLTAVTPSQTNVDITFTVSNEGNEAQDFIFSAQDIATSASFQINGAGTSYTDEVVYAAASGATFWEGAVAAGLQIQAGSTLNVPANTDQAAATKTKTITMRLNMPAAPAQIFNVSAADAVFPILTTIDATGTLNDVKVDTAALGVTVTAKATDGSGIQLTLDKTAANGLTTKENVFADAVAVLTSGTSYKSEKSTTTGYKFGTAMLKMTKAAAITAMPAGVTGYTNNAAIPGATVEYTITVQNYGTGAASSVAVSDTLPTTLDYSTLALTSTTGAATSNADTATGVVNATYTSVAAAGNSGDTQTLKFTAKIK
ncbi:MAG: DUF11 domain-containing protein [Oceanospirillaceae bacterium]|nr:DUF11 domain-containing protein [Oceanospirillaceae bacterium]